MWTWEDTGSVVEAAFNLHEGGYASARAKLILKSKLMDTEADKPEKEDMHRGTVPS